MSGVGMFVVPHPELILCVHWPHDGDRFVADQRCMSGWQDLGIERLIQIGRLQRIADTQGANVVSEQR